MLIQETQEMCVWSHGWEISWVSKWQPTSVFLPGKFYGQRSLESYSSWSRKELDVTEHAHTHTHAHTHSLSDPFPCRLLHNVEYSSLCFTVGLSPPPLNQSLLVGNLSQVPHRVGSGIFYFDFFINSVSQACHFYYFCNFSYYLYCY